jgi:hypothetical protein
MQMANSLAQEHDLAPAWISDSGAMHAAIERFRRSCDSKTAEFASKSPASTPRRATCSAADKIWEAYGRKLAAPKSSSYKRYPGTELKSGIVPGRYFHCRLDDELNGCCSPLPACPEASWLHSLVGEPIAIESRA